MSNEIQTLDTAAKALAHLAQESGGAGAPLLKFSKDTGFVLGGDHIPEGKEYVAHVTEVAKGWSKFVGGALVDKKIGKVVDGYVPPERDELDDRDQARWPKDTKGEARDPWVSQVFLPMTDCETGQLVIFTSSSYGGKGAVGTLAGVAARNIRRGNPKVRLKIGSYKHRSYGRVQVPEFVIAGWDSPSPSMAMQEPEYEYGDEIM